MTIAVLITGAGSGIGRASAEYLAARDVLVFAGVRKHAHRRALGRWPNIVPIQLDVTDAAQVVAAVDHVSTRRGSLGLDGLVNNAGVAIGGPLVELDETDLIRQLDVNLIGTFRVTKAFFPLLRAAKGRIVNVSSMAGRIATPFLGPYCMSKFGLEAYSDALRLELAPFGIDVSVVQPGPTRTPIWDKVDPDTRRYDGSPFEARARKVARQMIEEGTRGGLPASAIAKAIAHALLSRDSHTRYTVTTKRSAQLVLEHLPDRYRDWILGHVF